MIFNINVLKLRQIIVFLLIICINISYVFSDWEYGDVFQKSVDKHFWKIDTEIKIYLDNLNKEKDFCFWKNKKQDFVECINKIENKFEEYSIKYNNICTKVLTDTIKKQEGGTIAAKDGENFINNTWTSLCTKMYEFKITIYRWVAYDILKRNKYQILKDENKLFTQEQRKKYNKLLDLVRINIWYIERLRKKWPSKTK
jgi:hypothetical protein